MKKIGKFLKGNIKLVIGLVIGAVVAGGGVYAASETTFSSGVVDFDNSKANLTLNGESVDNVQDALDALYEKASNASGCPAGYIKIDEISTKYSCARQVTITLNPNGGSVDPTTLTLTLTSESTTYGILPTPTPPDDDYYFIGWYTDAIGGTKVENKTTFTDGTSATTLYAHYSNSAAVTLINTVSGLENVADAYRYVGANPDNYVSFNNQTWRIIGIYGDKLKIIKASPSIYSQQWDLIGGTNNSWKSSVMLNTYLYGTYWKTLSSDAIDMIEQSATWNIGSVYYNSIASTAYSLATGETWTGKIGLIASYEYLYAATSDCWSIAGDSYNSSCKSKDWLFNTLSPTAWTITARRSDDSVLTIYDTGSIFAGALGNTYTASPVVYLKSGVTISGGSGKSGDMYTLEAPILMLSSISGEVKPGDSTSVTITTKSDGALSCLTSDSSIATCSISGTTLTINGVASGNATITVSQAVGTTYGATFQRYDLTVASWHEIRYYYQNCGSYCSNNCRSTYNTSVWSCYYSGYSSPPVGSASGSYCYCKY